MSMAETAKLAVDLSFKSNAGTVLGGVNRQLGTLDTSAAKLHRGFTTLGAGIGTAIRNGAVLAGAGIAALVGLVAVSAKEGQEAAKVQQIYATAIGNSGKVSTAYVGILNAQQTALMNLAGVDDELIKSEQTRLIQMGLTGDAVSKLTPLILDASKATGKDLLTVTVAAGKAANGQATALARLGIQVDKARFKIDPLAETVRVLNERFGGTVKALSENPDTKLDVRLGALRENLANIREESGIKLLPALTRIVDVVGKSLVPAFGKFVDRILPDISKGIDTFASALEGGGAERSINGIADALGSMIDLLKIAAGPVKAIVSAFMSLPKEVQGILVGGFAINKLSGGMIGQGLGQIAGGLIQRGGTPANPLYVADVTGGIGGKGGLPGVPAAVGGAGILSTVAALAGAVAAAAIPIAVAYGLSRIVNPEGAPGMGTPTPGAGRLHMGDQGVNAFNIDAVRAADAADALATAAKGAADALTAEKFGPPAPAEKFGPPVPHEGLAGVSVRGWAAGNKPTAANVAATFAKNQRISVELTALGPGAEGVYKRAVAAGLHPSMATVAASLARNTAAGVKTAAAASKTTAAVFAGAAKTQLRLGDVNRTIANKSFAPNVTVPVSVSTTTNVSVRDSLVRTSTYNRYYGSTKMKQIAERFA